MVDPDRNVESYLNMAEDMGWKITHILLTHLHADFVSGHLELADLTGADIYAPSGVDYGFSAIPQDRNSSFSIEDIDISVLRTPGHTPEHISYVVADTSRGEDPVCVFCGDTLFVGDVGRPDLFPGRAKELAGKLYESLRTLSALPDSCEVYPAHGAGSLCGRAMAAKRSSTIGYEKKYNYALNISNKKNFISSLTGNMPPAPDHFSRCTISNKEGPQLIRSLSSPVPLSPSHLSEKLLSEHSVVLDVRSYEAYGGQHVPGSYSIDLGGNFATFSGWLLPPDKTIYLVVDGPEQAKMATFWLHRVGLDNISAYLEGGMYAWALSGLPTGHLCQLSSIRLHEIAENETDMVILDVRAESEYKQYHIPGAVNIPLESLRTRFDELDPRDRIITVCGSGHRSSMGASILEQKGFRNLYNAAGGMAGYNAAGYGQECKLCRLPWTGNA